MLGSAAGHVTATIRERKRSTINTVKGRRPFRMEKTRLSVNVVELGCANWYHDRGSLVRVHVLDSP
jgi:hypothetical protein